MSSAYIVSARKYRPSTFRSVVGQPSLTLTLKNAIESGRLAQAYLFCGPRGVGKTSCARIFAKTINCEHRTAEGEACNECESCKAFNQGRSINIVELDAASNNGVDNIRALNDQVRVPPQMGRYRVFIIDEVHMLSQGAFNAFLKTLEEPPSYVIFILATTEKHKVIPTILSRCQIYDFNRIGVNDIAEHLSYVASQENIKAEPSALGVIARKADGAMRDALSIFDQVAASTRGNITYKGTIDNLNVLDYEFYFRLVDAFLRGDVPEALLIYKEVRDKGFDSLSFVAGLASHLRELTVAVVPQTLPLLEVSADVAERYRQQAAQLKPQWAYAAMEAVNYCDLNYRTSGNKQFLVELTLIRLCQLADPTGATDSKGIPSRPVLRRPEPSATSADAANSVSAHTPQTQNSHINEPLPKPAPAAQGVSRTKLSTSSISVSKLSASKDTPARPADVSVTPNTAANVQAGLHTATDAEVTDAWHQFSAMHPNMHLLNSMMRTCLPKSSGSASEYEVAVDNPGQLLEFEKFKGQIIPFLRERVGDNSLTLQARVADRGERPRVLTPGEAFAAMLEENENVRKVLAELEASLSD